MKPVSLNQLVFMLRGCSLALCSHIYFTIGSDHSLSLSLSLALSLSFFSLSLFFSFQLFRFRPKIILFEAKSSIKSASAEAILLSNSSGQWVNSLVWKRRSYLRYKPPARLLARGFSSSWAGLSALSPRRWSKIVRACWPGPGLCAGQRPRG